MLLQQCGLKMLIFNEFNSTLHKLMTLRKIPVIDRLAPKHKKYILTKSIN